MDVSLWANVDEIMIKRLRIAEVALAIVGAVSFGASWLLNYWMWQEMPRAPEGSFVVPMINHGVTIYLSRTYSTLYDVLFWGGLALFGCAILIDFYKDPFGRRGAPR
jgi:hypothetical protein